jgi:cephalosporin hydroxylase
VVQTPVLQAAGPSFVEAAMSSWFHKLSRFQQRISNAAKGIQSLAAAVSADWKALHRAPCFTQRAAHRDIVCRLSIVDMVLEQNLLNMVFQTNFSLSVVVRSGSLG